MNRRHNVSLPRYMLVAHDMACKIADGLYKEGETVYARSALASQYGVSSETARRAICVLDDLGIVESTKGSGVKIVSYEKAVEYARHSGDFSSIHDLREDLLECVKKQRDDCDELNALLETLIKKSEHFSTSNPFVPFQTKIAEGSHVDGKTLAELNFWHNTLATVVALRKGEELILSPGPYAALRAGDVLYYIGDSGCIDRVNRFLGQSD